MYKYHIYMYAVCLVYKYTCLVTCINNRVIRKFVEKLFCLRSST